MLDREDITVLLEKKPSIKRLKSSLEGTSCMKIDMNYQIFGAKKNEFDILFDNMLKRIRYLYKFVSR